MKLQTKDDKAKEQSKHTLNYVLQSECAMWGTRANPGCKRSSGIKIWKNGRFLRKIIDGEEIKDFEQNNPTEWVKSAKEIRQMIK